MSKAPLDRFVALCESAGGAGTIFAIGRDLRGVVADRLRALTAQGFEIASHSDAHDYRLAQRDPAFIRAEVERGREALSRAIGRAPEGFRAPGYHLSPALCDALESLDCLRLVGDAEPPVLRGQGVGARELPPARPFLDLGARLTAPELRTAAPYRPGRDPVRRGTGVWWSCRSAWPRPSACP